MRKLFQQNGLSIVSLALFLIFVVAESIVGHRYYNQEQREHQQPVVTYSRYVAGNHFLEAVMENWESEFLQMFFFIVLTAVLYQKGSAESKDPDKQEQVDKNTRNAITKHSPSPVKQGGWRLRLYEHSLSLVFLTLFLATFFLHAKGGAADYNEEQRAHGSAVSVTMIEYIGTSRFWFESFQNWQSEFLAVGLMVVLTIFLRERGSKESKPVAAAHDESGK